MPAEQKKRYADSPYLRLVIQRSQAAIHVFVHFLPGSKHFTLRRDVSIIIKQSKAYIYEQNSV